MYVYRNPIYSPGQPFTSCTMLAILLDAGPNNTSKLCASTDLGLG